MKPLPALVDAHEAFEAATLLHERAAGNVLFRWLRKGGDVEGAFSRADRVVRGRFHIPRLVAAAIEARGAAAAHDRGEASSTRSTTPTGSRSRSRSRTTTCRRSTHLRS